MNHTIKTNGKGLITLETDGLPQPEVERLRKILHTVISHGVLGIVAGTMTLNFNDKGEVSTIEILKRWRKLDELRSPL